MVDYFDPSPPWPEDEIVQNLIQTKRPSVLSVMRLLFALRLVRSIEWGVFFVDDFAVLKNLSQSGFASVPLHALVASVQATILAIDSEILTVCSPQRLALDSQKLSALCPPRFREVESPSQLELTTG
jgi:hypothetical protein